MENNDKSVVVDNNQHIEINRAKPGNDQLIVMNSEEIARIIVNALSSIKIYVVESDITEAQNRVRAVVEQTSF